MQKLLTIVLSAATVIFTNLAFAQQFEGSKYSGQEKRAINSLSPADIDELNRGDGWGLAKAAELNGVPGPAHLLELKRQIPLSPDQAAKISAIYEGMKSQAIIEGKRLIELERQLELRFRDGTISENSLRALLSDIADARSQLRYTHLSAHLETPTILSKRQIAQYKNLRGYTDNPRAGPPKGHDPALWRQHNGCD